MHSTQLNGKVTRVDYSGKTVPQVLHNASHQWGSEPAVISAEGQVWLWRDYQLDCYACAKSLISIGLRPHETCCIMGFNCREWLVASVGTNCAQGVSAGIYTTNQVDLCTHIVRHSGCTVVFCEKSQLHKFEVVLPELKALIFWDDLDEHEEKEEVETCPTSNSCTTYTFHNFLQLGQRW